MPQDMCLLGRMGHSTDSGSQAAWGSPGWWHAASLHIWRPLSKCHFSLELTGRLPSCHCADRRSLSGSQSTCYVSPASGARPASGRRMQKTTGTHLPTALLCLVSALPAPVRPGEEISPPGHPRAPQRGPLPSAGRECPCEDGPSGGRGASAFLPRLDERCPQDEGEANCAWALHRGPLVGPGHRP